MTSGTSHSKPVVLVVDDETGIHASFRDFLGLHGFATKHAMTLAEAHAAAGESRIDAVILDLRLRKGESGVDFLSWFRLQPGCERTPVLVLTGQTRMAEDDEEVIRRQQAYVFFKPHSYHDIVEYLQRLTSDPDRR